MNIDMVLIILALVFFALAAVGADIKINAIAAGLFCATLTLLL